MRLKPKGTVALEGCSGAGKSTITRMILGMKLPDAGNISVLGMQ
ncbi:ATP-binding cassette domain-containing protein, partial [Rhizobium ruizarguesonis]